MSLPDVLQSFIHDKQLNTVAILIAADLVFGILAAVKAGTFQFSYITQFLHDDVLAKVVPWLALFTFGKLDHGTVIAGYGTWNDVSTGAFALVVAALTASLVKSFADLGVPVPAPVVSIAGKNPFKASPTYLAADGDDRAVLPKAA